MTRFEEGDFDRVVAHDLPLVGGEETDEVVFDSIYWLVAFQVGGEVLVVG
jgi:hypothetical protein